MGGHSVMHPLRLHAIAGFGAELAAATDKQLLGLAAQHAVEGELALGCASELEEQLAAVVGHGVHRIDQAHPRVVVEVGAVGDVLQKHQNVAVEVGLGDQGDELLLARGRRRCAPISTIVAPEP